MPIHERELSEVIVREQGKLKHFIRKWVVEESDAEDVLQEVFYELVEAYRLMTPIQQISAWMYRVARNRITDLFRRRRSVALREPFSQNDVEENLHALEEWLPSNEEGPDASFTRKILLKELDQALDELPEEQRLVFMAHEVEGLSFKEISEFTGIPINTLLSRKHYAVKHLRKRLRAIYEDYIHV